VVFDQGGGAVLIMYGDRAPSMAPRAIPRVHLF
jgi:hypothetical protein